MGEGKREQSQLLVFVYIQCVKNLSGGGIVVISFSTLANSPKQLNLPVVMHILLSWIAEAENVCHIKIHVRTNAKSNN